jgi:hypothetical protein
MEETFSVIDEIEAALPAYVPRVVLGEPVGADWFALPDLTDPRSGQLRAVLNAMAEVRGYPMRRTLGASFALLASPAAAGLVWRATRGLAIAELAPDRTQLRISPSGNVLGIATKDRPGYAGPEKFGFVLHALLDGLMDAIRVETGFPLRSLWSIVTSGLSQNLIDWLPENHRQAVSQIEAMLAADNVLAGSKPRITWLDECGVAKAFTTRQVCCYNYLGKSRAYCGSQCPIIPEEERTANARQRFAGKNE